HISPRKGLTIGMRERMCKRQGIVNAGQGLLRVPQQPEGHSAIGSAGHTRILAYAERRPIVLVWRGACNGFLQMLAGRWQYPMEEPRNSKSIVRDASAHWVVGLLRQVQQSFSQLSRHMEL